MQQYFDNIFSKYQCSVRKDYNLQHCLTTRIEKWRENVDKYGTLGGSLIDLSKAFDSLPPELNYFYTILI